MPGLSLVAWAKVKWDGTNWTLIAGSGFSAAASVAAYTVTLTFSAAQPDTSYVFDCITNSYATNPIWAYSNAKAVGSLPIVFQTGGGNSNAVAGDTVYVGVYR